MVKVVDRWGNNVPAPTAGAVAEALEEMRAIASLLRRRFARDRARAGLPAPEPAGPITDDEVAGAILSVPTHWADEITLTAIMELTNGDLEESYEVRNLSRNQTTAAARKFTWSVGTAEEDFVTTDLSSPRYCFFRNIDPTNYVDWGMSDAGTMKAVSRLLAGDIAMFPIKPSTTVRAAANTAACKLITVCFDL